VRIAGRLSETTLGDVLGALFRARVTGLVRLAETAAPSAGRTHEIYLRQGLVVAVESPLDMPAELPRRLDTLFSVREASLTFHVACPAPPGPPRPLSPREYLYGRPRARDRQHAGAPRTMSSGRALSQALSLLGLDAGATAAEVKRAFRRCARELHPDRYPGAAHAERRSVEQRFAALSAAYHTLLASGAG